MKYNILRKFGFGVVVISFLFAGFMQFAEAAPDGIWCGGEDCYESQSDCERGELISATCVKTANTQMYCNIGTAAPASSADCYNTMENCQDSSFFGGKQDCAAVSDRSGLDNVMKLYAGIELAQNGVDANLDDLDKLINKPTNTQEEFDATQAQILEKMTAVNNGVAQIDGNLALLSNSGAQIQDLADDVSKIAKRVQSIKTSAAAKKPPSGGTNPYSSQIVDTAADVQTQIKQARAIMLSEGLISGENAMVYIPLEKTFITQTDTYLPNFLRFIFKTGVVIAGISALVMLIIGGIMYVGSAGNQATATSAKGVIRDALLGVIMVFFSWLLLFVINPDLISIEDNLVQLTKSKELRELKPGDKASQAPNAKASGNTTVNGNLDAQGMVDEQAARDRLKSGAGAGIEFNREVDDPCPTCTFINGLPPKSFEVLKEINSEVKKLGGTGIKITGAAEPGHITHGAGKNVFDISVTSELTKYINANGKIFKTGKFGKTNDAPFYRMTSGPLKGKQVVMEKNPLHYHISLDKAQ